MRIANMLHSLSIHLLRRARSADKETGLSPERLSLLSIIAYAGPKTINRLAEVEGVSPPAISRIVTSLETLRLAQRKRSRVDARTVSVHATAKGRRLVEAGRGRRLERIADELAQLKTRDLATLGRIGDILVKLE